jgi:hypothetical protein
LYQDIETPSYTLISPLDKVYIKNMKRLINKKRFSDYILAKDKLARELGYLNRKDLEKVFAMRLDERARALGFDSHTTRCEFVFSNPDVEYNDYYNDLKRLVCLRKGEFINLTVDSLDSVIESTTNTNSNSNSNSFPAFSSTPNPAPSTSNSNSTPNPAPSNTTSPSPSTPSTSPSPSPSKPNPPSPSPSTPNPSTPNPSIPSPSTSSPNPSTPNPSTPNPSTSSSQRILSSSQRSRLPMRSGRITKYDSTHLNPPSTPRLKSKSRMTYQLPTSTTPGVMVTPPTPSSSPLSSSTDLPLPSSTDLPLPLYPVDNDS